MEPYIKVENLSFYRGHRSIFSDLSMEIPKGKVTAIMGPSGIGKTTLLKLIGGQLKAASGRVLIDGKDFSKLNRKKLFKAREKIGMLFQSGALFSDLSVFENIAFPIRAHTNLPDDMIRDIVLMKLHAVGLRGARHLMPSELSGGMTRRIALARSIALDPDLIMYDEPFAGQDPIAMGVLVQLIRLLNDALDLTSILVSHDIAEAMSIADHAIIIADGRVIGSGAPAELKKHESPLVKQFVNGLPDGPVPFHYPAGDYRSDLLGQ